MYPQGLLVPKILATNNTRQEGFEVFMGHSNVIFQSVFVFESFSTLIALQPGVIVLPSVFEKRPLVLEGKQTLTTLQSHSLQKFKYEI